MLILVTLSPDLLVVVVLGGVDALNLVDVGVVVALPSVVVDVLPGPLPLVQVLVAGRVVRQRTLVLNDSVNVLVVRAFLFLVRVPFVYRVDIYNSLVIRGALRVSWTSDDLRRVVQVLAYIVAHNLASAL